MPPKKPKVKAQPITAKKITQHLPVTTPLHNAAMLNDTEAASALIEMKADVNATATNVDHLDIRKNPFLARGTPLHMAASAGSTAVMRLLLENKADVNRLDEIGDTPLHNAVRGNFHEEEAIRMLLASNANPSLKDAYGVTPAQLAYFDGEKLLGDILTEAERKKTSVSAGGNSPAKTESKGASLTTAKQLKAPSSSSDSSVTSNTNRMGHTASQPSSSPTISSTTTNVTEAAQGSNILNKLTGLIPDEKNFGWSYVPSQGKGILRLPNDSGISLEIITDRLQKLGLKVAVKTSSTNTAGHLITVDGCTKDFLAKHSDSLMPLKASSTAISGSAHLITAVNSSPMFSPATATTPVVSSDATKPDTPSTPARSAAKR